MANHKSAKKRIRANNSRRLQNRIYAKAMRASLKEIRILIDSEKNAAMAKLPEMNSMIDKLAKKGIIHKNKAANLKSGIMKKMNTVA